MRDTMLEKMTVNFQNIFGFSWDLGLIALTKWVFKPLMEYEDDPASSRDMNSGNANAPFEFFEYIPYDIPDSTSGFSCNIS